MEKNVPNAQIHIAEFNRIHDEVESIAVLCSASFVLSRPLNTLSGPGLDQGPGAANLYGRDWESLAAPMLLRLPRLLSHLYGAFLGLAAEIEKLPDERDAA